MGSFILTGHTSAVALVLFTMFERQTQGSRLQDSSQVQCKPVVWLINVGKQDMWA